MLLSGGRRGRLSLGEVRCCGWARVLLSPVRVLHILLFCALKPPTLPSVGGPLISYRTCAGPEWTHQSLGLLLSWEELFSQDQCSEGVCFQTVCVLSRYARTCVEEVLVGCHLRFICWVSFFSTGNSHFQGIVYLCESLLSLLSVFLRAYVCVY